MGNNGRSLAVPFGQRAAVLPDAPEIISYSYQDNRVPGEGSRHFHWTIQAFSRMDKDGGMSDVSIVRVEGPDEATAISRAMDIIVRNKYRVMDVTEICSKDTALKDG